MMRSTRLFRIPSSKASFSQINIAKEATPVTSRAANMPITSGEGAEQQQQQQVAGQSVNSPRSSPSATSAATPNSKQSPLPQAVASMSDAEFDESIDLLKSIAKKSLRSFVVFVGGMLALWYAKRKKLNQQRAEEAAKEEESGGAEENLAEKFIEQIRNTDWSGTEQEQPEGKEAEKKAS